MCSAPVSQLPTPNTLAGSISTITVGILPPTRVLAEDLTKAQREGSPNLLQIAFKCVGKQATSESTDSHSAVEQGGTKNNQASSSKPRVLTTHLSGPGSSGGAAGDSGQDPNELRWGSPIWPWLSPMSLLMTHTRLYLLRMPSLFPFLPRQNLEGFDWGYLLPAEVIAFQGIYYHESGDVRPSYTGASPWDYPLDCQGHVASRLDSGVATFSSYIGLVSTGIVYSQQEDANIKIDQYSYFNITGTVPPPTHHGIWGCLHYLPLVLNIFVA